jgi:hypothetical protein
VRKVKVKERERKLQTVQQYGDCATGWTVRRSIPDIVTLFSSPEGQCRLWGPPQWKLAVPVTK